MYYSGNIVKGKADSAQQATVFFWMDGEHISENASIYRLELQDQDEIHAVHEQCGC